jgi:hypothetical protein
MQIKAGRRIALAVETGWYQTLQGHNVLKNAIPGHPTDILIGIVEELDLPHGVWIKPDDRFSDSSKSSLFVPYRFIVAAVLLDVDDEAKILKGFSGL